MAGMVIQNLFLSVGLISFFMLPISLSENGIQFGMLIDPNLQAVEFGEMLKVNCSTTCESPQPEIIFELKERSEIETNGTTWKEIFYVKVQSWDISIVCLVECGSDNDLIRLVLPVYDRDLNITPPPERLVENKQYSLECIGPRVYPKDKLILRWLKGNKTLQTESPRDPGFPDEDTRLRNVLNINAGKSDDGQNYTCVAEIALGPNDTLKIQTSSITLQVNYAPTVNNHKTSEFWVEGKPQNINCNVEGNPAPQRAWIKDGKPRTEDEMLHIPSVHMDDAGLYTCTATNAYGSTNYSLIVTVQYKPRNMTISSDKNKPTPKSPIQISSSDNITLTCYSEANPSANYSWEYPNQSTDVKVFPTGVLFISNANSEHSGIYKCTARNHLGTDVQKVEIKVKVTEITSLVAGFIVGVITLGVGVGVVAYYWYHKARGKGEYNLQNAKPNNNPQIPNALQENIPLKNPKA